MFELNDGRKTRRKAKLVFFLCKSHLKIWNWVTSLSVSELNENTSNLELFIKSLKLFSCLIGNLFTFSYFHIWMSEMCQNVRVFLYDLCNSTHFHKIWLLRHSRYCSIYRLQQENKDMMLVKKTTIDSYKMNIFYCYANNFIPDTLYHLI